MQNFTKLVLYPNTSMSNIIIREPGQLAVYLIFLPLLVSKMNLDLVKQLTLSLESLYAAADVFQ